MKSLLSALHWSFKPQALLLLFSLVLGTSTFLAVVLLDPPFWLPLSLGGGALTIMLLVLPAFVRREQTLRQLFGSMFEGYALHEVLVDKQGRPIDYRWLDVNPSFERLTGLKRENLIGRRLTEVLTHTEDYWIKTYDQVSSTGHPLVFENFSHEFGRHYRTSSFQPQRGQLAVVIEDVTERKTSEAERERLIKELESRNSELNRFVYTASHDLKAPLLAITGFLTYIRKDILAGKTDSALTDLDRVEKTAAKMTGLLDDLLALSRLQQVPVIRQPVSLGDTFAQAKESFEIAFRDSSASLTIDGEWPILPVDSARMTEVWQNLLENALKYRRPEVALRLTLRISRIAPVAWEFRLTDNGIGLPTDRLDWIFGLFDKLDANSPGSGVGLAIVKKIIESHGGTIRAESAGPGTGTTMIFTLPTRA